MGRESITPRYSMQLESIVLATRLPVSTVTDDVECQWFSTMGNAGFLKGWHSNQELDFLANKCFFFVILSKLINAPIKLS